MSISVSNLSKHYGAQKAVNNISFRVGKGEIVGFLGPNGAGKSTTMKMITGYLEADAGTISVSGIDVAENNIASKKKIGYLPEANPLYAEMYVREYLHFTAGVHGLDNIKQRTETIIQTVGLTAEANKKIGQLSKGYKQRVGLAAALIHEPEVLLLDEPTSGLDPNQIIEIRNLIKSLSKEKTVLFSSHILQEVEAICDRVIIINKGTIVADDLLKNLQRSGNNLNRVNVEFRETIPVENFSGITSVRGIEQLTTSKYQLTTDQPESVRKQLLQLSIENNWNIVSLQNEVAGLEEIFKTLTADPAK
ncbi:MAG: gliding motility-associated ABC transporter ATP-binding subunit GldA [Ferruginibacter sp.]